MSESGHFVAIFGGGVAGVEAAYQLSKNGIYVALFEQNPLPYGKIEEGLPKWHVKLRNQEERKIDEKLQQPGVYFVPKIRLDETFSLREVMNWDFSAVLLAVGAWRDRPLPVPGINNYEEKGLYYQNPFVAWFNHNHESGYKEYQYEVRDGAVVIGGGLASLDVVKILTLETTRQRLEAIGEPVDLFALERQGINLTLQELGLTMPDLNMKGCTLYYRRRIGDMPLAPLPKNLSPEKEQKFYILRERILQNFQKRYLFNVQENAVPVDKIVEKDRLAGLIFRKTRMQNGMLTDQPGTDFEVRTPLVVSSIGSIPQPLEHLPFEGELLSIRNEETGQISGYDNLFALGNAVTGRGNIKESTAHSRYVTGKLLDDFFDMEEEYYETLIQQREENSKEKVEKIRDRLAGRQKLTGREIDSLLEKIRYLNEKTGYEGNYERWIDTHLPPRLEHLLNIDDFSE
jgi:ferredoxin--NADP+ reductase